MSNFVNFLKINGLKKSEIASFLGVSNAFITQICSGKRNLPDEKLALIKAETKWDVSMLYQSEDSMEDQPFDDGYIRRLKEELAEKDAQIYALQKRIWDLEKLLEQKGENLAGSADLSSSVNVG